MHLTYLIALTSHGSAQPLGSSTFVAGRALDTLMTAPTLFGSLMLSQMTVIGSAFSLIFFFAVGFWKIPMRPGQV